MRSGSSCACPAGKEDIGGSCLDTCTGGKVRNGEECECANGMKDVEGECVEESNIWKFVIPGVIILCIAAGIGVFLVMRNKKNGKESLTAKIPS